jgi:phosphatidylserine decarboxylase
MFYMMEIKIINRKSGKIEIENPPNKGLLKFIFTNPLGLLPLHLVVKRKFLSILFGKQMNKKSSARRIQQFVEDFNINMNESILKVTEFKTFNDFFYRKLKSISRPIMDGLVSPADGKALVFEQVSHMDEFFVKGKKFTLDKFLQDNDLANTYEDASLVIIRLAPNDYHRYHFPYDGVISSTEIIDGFYYSVSPFAVKENVSIFCENKRSLSTLRTRDKGDILISEVGATMVGSIYQTYEPNTLITKGMEKGYFSFGGSTVILIVDSSKVKFEKDLLENTKNGFETTVKMGEKIGE